MKDLKLEVLNTKSKEELSALIEAGIIRQEWLSLIKGFNSLYAVTNTEKRTITSYKTGKDIEVDVFEFSNDENTIGVWESNLWKMFVIDEEPEDEGIVGDLPVWFYDDFLGRNPGCKTLKDFKNDKGALTVWNQYHIVGAVVAESKVRPGKWMVNFRLYKQGKNFLKLEQQIVGDSKLTWISEERLHELAAMNADARTLKDKEGKKIMVLPSTGELEVLYHADTDPRFASARFVVKKIWK